MCMQDTYARCREVCIHLAASTVIPESVAPLFFNRIEGKWTGQHHIVGSKAIVTTHRWRISPNAMVTMSFLGF